MLSLTQQTSSAYGSSGHNLVPPTITYRASTPVRVPEDYATLQDAFDTEVVGKTWRQTATAISGTMSMTSGSELITGTSSTFLADADEDDYLSFIGQFYPIRDITDDSNLRLWKGGNHTITAVGSIAKPTNVTIITSNDVNTLTGTIPDGVSLQIVGSDISKRITVGVATVICGSYANFEIHNMQVIEGVTSLITSLGFGSVAPRGVYRATQLSCLADSTLGFFLFAGSAVIFSNITANKWKVNCFSDYFSATNISTMNGVDDDVMLMAIASATNDIAYEHEINGFHIFKTDGSIGNFNGGLEWNNWSASKVANVRNSFVQNQNVTVEAGNDSYPIWLPINGTINFIDSIIDSDSVVEEIFSRGATVTFSNTFKLDGITVPRESP